MRRGLQAATGGVFFERVVGQVRRCKSVNAVLGELHYPVGIVKTGLAVHQAERPLTSGEPQRFTWGAQCALDFMADGDPLEKTGEPSQFDTLESAHLEWRSSREGAPPTGKEAVSAGSA